MSIRNNELDTHYSFLNIIIKGYVIGGNDITIEVDIVDAFCFEGSITGSITILCDGLGVVVPVLKDNNIFKVSKISVIEMHEV